MQKSQSVRFIQNDEKSLARSPSRRLIYINEQSSKRDVSSIFHSPFKDGRKNKDYVNPSFVSSSLFYPKELAESSDKVLVRKGIVPTAADLKKQMLYKERIKDESVLLQNWREKQKEEKQRQRQFKKQSNLSRILRFNDPEKLLKNQLQSLQSYQQNRERSSSHLKRNTQAKATQAEAEKKQFDQVPIYLEKERKNPFYDEIKFNERKDQLNKYQRLNEQYNQIKRQFKKELLKDENAGVSRYIHQYEETKISDDERHLKQSALLGNILREQIKNNQARRNHKYY